MHDTNTFRRDPLERRGYRLHLTIRQYQYAIPQTWDDATFSSKHYRKAVGRSTIVHSGEYISRQDKPKFG